MEQDRRDVPVLQAGVADDDERPVRAAVDGQKREVLGEDVHALRKQRGGRAGQPRCELQPSPS